MKIQPRTPPLAGWNGFIRTECDGDVCACKRGMLVHPPLVLIFDPEAGEYQIADARCTARWASSDSRYGRAEGQMCGQRAEHQVGDVWACDSHLARLRKWFKEVQPRIDKAITTERLALAQEEIWRREEEDHKERMRLRRQEAALERELVKERVRAEVAARAESSLVYYFQRDDGSIKIGFSGSIAQRFVTLKQKHGPLRVMATHGGGIAEERDMHEQFRKLRIDFRQEWFRPGLDLLVHIRQVRQDHEVICFDHVPVVDMREIVREITRLRKLESEAAA